MTEQELCTVLGKNIKKYRIRYNMSQEKLAGRLDISTNFLSDIETGKSWISQKTAVKLADEFGVEVHNLFMQDKILLDDTAIIIKKYTDEVRTAVNRSLDTLYEDLRLEPR